MQPVRVTMEGYVPRLPLRMIAAGVADKVGLSLVVFSDARIEASNFPNGEALLRRELHLGLGWAPEPHAGLPQRLQRAQPLQRQPALAHRGGQPHQRRELVHPPHLTAPLGGCERRDHAD